MRRLRVPRHPVRTVSHRRAIPSSLGFTRHRGRPDRDAPTRGTMGLFHAGPTHLPDPR
jgi:hypothetical protein